MSVVVTAVTLGLIIVGAILIALGALGKNRSFGYTKIFGYYQDRTYNLINGKYANIASVLVGVLFIAIALIVYFI